MLGPPGGCFGTPGSFRAPDDVHVFLLKWCEVSSSRGWSSPWCRHRAATLRVTPAHHHEVPRRPLATAACGTCRRSGRVRGIAGQPRKGWPSTGFFSLPLCPFLPLPLSLFGDGMLSAHGETDNAPGRDQSRGLGHAPSPASPPPTTAAGPARSSLLTRGSRPDAVEGSPESGGTQVLPSSYGIHSDSSLLSLLVRGAAESPCHYR